MPRDLGDVLHFFLPTPADGVGTATGADEEGSDGELRRPAALPILALPVGDRDVVRAAFAWNLAVEIARLGGSASLLAPVEPETSALWPEPGRGPMGSEVILTRVDDLAGLTRAALDVAVNRAADSSDGGVVLVRVPPAWLRNPRDGRAALRWTLLFATPDARDLRGAYALAKPLLRANPSTRIGVTIHGARRVADATRAWERVAGAASRHLGHSLVSYGLLVDDLHVYRAIVARRPIGLEHPQSPAARALRDVARLVLEDARKIALA